MVQIDRFTMNESPITWVYCNHFLLTVQAYVQHKIINFIRVIKLK